MLLKIGKYEVTSIFDLLGSNEDSFTYAIGYCLSQNPVFLNSFLNRLIGIQLYDAENTVINLQRYNSKDKGETDIELFDNNNFHLIVEAKKGWNFPTDSQLSKYATRFSKENIEITQKLVVLTENTIDYVNANYKPIDLGFEIIVVSWFQINELIKSCTSQGKYSNRKLLSQLNKFLTKNSSMQNIDSNLVYVVSLGSGFPDNWNISWIDIVVKKNRYFHPIGGGRGGWPKEPPNYIAFRYQGRLQSIHHIETYKSIVEPSKFFDEAPEGFRWDKRHFLYELGPAIYPPTLTKSGKKIVRSNRVWAALDLLLTSSTIEEARDLTKQRLGQL